ncbi:MAG: HaeIII family restriction endonuclease [Dehalococcoidia bacterium]
MDELTPSQVESGHAFEYGLAQAFHRLYHTSTLRNDQFMQRAEQSFVGCSDTEQDKIVRAADEIACFLIAHDSNLRARDGYTVWLQSDMEGVSGDVRDVVIGHDTHEVGISAKNRHAAVKHSRLSERIDFGRKWLGIPCDPSYFHQIVPIFRELHTLRRQGTYWRDLTNKSQGFYIPVLNAFRDEAVRLCNANADAPRRMVEYLMGERDFYKVIKENGDVSAQSFNIHGTLGWGRHIRLPSRLVQAADKHDSDNTLIFYFDEGWSLSFRIHNAESLVMPSLKFDVQIVGLPNATSQNIHYG